MLARYGFALDSLTLEIEALPPNSRTSRALGDWLHQRAPTFDFLMGRLARMTLGRSVYDAVERFQRATNELILVAPPAVSDVAERIFGHLASFESETAWIQRLREMRVELAVASRRATVLTSRRPLHRLLERSPELRDTGVLIRKAA